MTDFIFALSVLQSFNQWREVLGADGICGLFCVVSPVSQNLYGQYLNHFYILGNMLHSDTPLIVAIMAQQMFIKCFGLFHKSQHDGNYSMMPFYWYLLFIGRMLCWYAYDTMFGDDMPFWGRQRITCSLPQPQITFTIKKECVKTKSAAYASGFLFIILFSDNDLSHLCVISNQFEGRNITRTM